jgi:heme/copper-type cytochrome/quinol oxidase subunit 2
MSGAQDTADMFTNMLMATGVLIAAVVVLVVVGLVVYYRTLGDKHENEEGVRS